MPGHCVQLRGRLLAILGGVPPTPVCTEMQALLVLYPLALQRLQLIEKLSGKAKVGMFADFGGSPALSL